MTRLDPRPSCDPSHPWAPAPMPALRSGPPFLMADAIEREPALAERLFTDAPASDAATEIADLLRSSASTGWPTTVVGCGTSEHAAMAAAAIWRDAWRECDLSGPGPLARQAFEAALDPCPGALVAMTHEGGTLATVDAMRAARQHGARIGLVTAAANSPAASVADACLCTGELDLSWCHTIAYVMPIVAAALIADRMAGRATAPGSVRAPLDAGLAAGEAAQALGRELAASRALVVVGSGVDRAAGREMALKIEEAAYVPTVFRDLETVLHGHIPSLDVGSGLVLILSGGDGLEARAARARQVLTAVSRVGVRCGAILSAPADAAIRAALTPAGRIVVPQPHGLAGPVASLLATAIPLQLATYHLALALGTNPDALRREFPPYRAAAHVGEVPAREADERAGRTG
ncbi:MAG TPA: SIS domain-containing protein [Candidatus Acidoferrales bacterium]|nr:SIS domain-containing protein [Candidatus Acidoferrales bacterium]